MTSAVPHGTVNRYRDVRADPPVPWHECPNSSTRSPSACSSSNGAFGTWVQDQELGPDDFGGPALEGCNERLVLTRPELIQQMHTEYFEAGVDAVETATFGAFGLVLTEYGIADETYAINEQAARLAKEVAAGFSTADRPRFVIGSIGPGTRLPSLGHISFAELRDDYEAMVAGLSPAAPTFSSSRRCRTSSRARRPSSALAARWRRRASRYPSWCR